MRIHCIPLYCKGDETMAKFTSKMLEIFANCLSAVESGGQIYGNGDWGNITLQYENSSEEHAITIGAYQRMGVEAKADLVRIRKEYPSVFSKYDTAGISEDLDSSDWSTYQLKSHTCSKARAISAIISSPEGIKIQKTTLGEDVNSYANSIESTYGVHRLDALLHLVNVQHLGGSGPLKRIIGRISGEVTLEKVRDSLAQDTTYGQVGADPYKTRQSLMYQWIHEKITPLLNDEGLLDNSGTNTDNSSGGTTMTASKVIQIVLNIARNEVGYLEKNSNSQLDSKTANAGYNNYTKYWRDIKPDYQTEPWCAAFVTWVLVQAFGKEVTKKLLRHYPYVYCPTLGSLFTKYANPKVGDIVIFYRHGEFAHTGFVTKVSGNYFWTIEGNTSGGSTIIENGGGVCEKGAYNNNDLIGTKFIRIDWDYAASHYKGSGSTNTGSNDSNTSPITWVATGRAKSTGDDVNVRKSATTSEDNVLRTVNKGNEFEVDGKTSGDFVHVNVSGTIGYIHKKYVEYINDSHDTYSTWVGAAKTNNVVVYAKSKGSTTLSAYPKLNKGNLVDVIGLSGSRYKVNIQGNKGYVNKKYIVTPDKLSVYPFTGKVSVSKDSILYVRTWAGTEYDTLTSYPSLKSGTSVKVLGELKATDGSKWYKVQIDLTKKKNNPKIGFVKASYITQVS